MTRNLLAVPEELGYSMAVASNAVEIKMWHKQPEGAPPVPGYTFLVKIKGDAAFMSLKLPSTTGWQLIRCPVYMIREEDEYYSIADLVYMTCMSARTILTEEQTIEHHVKKAALAILGTLSVEFTRTKDITGVLGPDGVIDVPEENK